MHESPRSGQKHRLRAAQRGLRTRRLDDTTPVPGGRCSSRLMTSSWESITLLERPLNRAADHSHCCQRCRRHLSLDSCLSCKASSWRINPLSWPHSFLYWYSFRSGMVISPEVLLLLIISTILIFLFLFFQMNLRTALSKSLKIYVTVLLRIVVFFYRLLLVGLPFLLC